MIEGTEVMAPMDYGFSEFGMRAPVSTRDVPFIVCGAFSGFDEMLKNVRNGIGFRDKEGERIEPLTMDEAASFQKYGFLPELIGRFSRIVSFPPLPRETLRRILEENILPQFYHEFRDEGLQLSVTDEAMEHIITRSHKRGTGARGLHTELITTLEKVAFETFMQKRDAAIVVTAERGRLISKIVG